jgi:hypothetical protein
VAEGGNLILIRTLTKPASLAPSLLILASEHAALNEAPS